jgi:hypothetical protein
MAFTYGIKVSEPGYDVNTAGDKNLSLKTGMTLLKVFSSGTTSLSGTWTEITHNLGYVPQFLVYVKDTTPNPDAFYLGTADLGTAVARADTSKVYIKQQNANQTEAYYYIFYEPADTGTAPSIVSTNDYGMKVSKDGYSVHTANILQQTFNSEKNSLKIALEGDTSSTANGSRTVTVAHGLSVIPAYFVLYEVENSGRWYPNFTEDDVHGAIVKAWTDDTNLNVQITTTSSQTVKIKYYILIDPIT